MNDIAGGIAGALNPDSKEAVRHAIRYYGLVRSMSADYKRIAKNTGFRERDILRIKKHVFIDTHELDDGIRRFDPDYEMAQSWQRLIDGRDIQPRDIVLLNHEFLELTYMSDGMNYDDAHDRAQLIYNFVNALKEAGKL